MDEKAKILFTKMPNKEALGSWIRVFLGLDIPDGIVDPTSNCTPLQMIWEVYERCILNDNPEFNRVLYYASRDSFKTLSAAILEVLSILHLGRSVAHMAAIKDQAGKAQQYVKAFFRRPYLRDYVEGDNKTETVVVRFYNKETGVSLTRKQYDALAEDAKNEYEEITNYIKIVVCTMQGANSEHVPLFVVDEVDVVENPKAYEEAKAIPAPLNGMMPITVLTSTRKFSFGLVQKEIEKADDTGLKIRHWNILDVTEKCPEKRHRPDLPRLPIYRSDETLKSKSEEEYQALDEESKKKYVKDEGYHGCLKNCKLFAMCQGRLATKQTSTSKLLKPIEHTTNQFRSFSPEMAKAQLLCWKPSTLGLIYGGFEKETHMLTPAQIAEKVTGEPQRPEFTKGELIALLNAREGGYWASGIDWGYTHRFAVVTAYIDGPRCFVIDVISLPELEPGDQLQVVNTKIKHLDPICYADPENPQMIAMFRTKGGFKMRKWKKGPGTVQGGIEICRLKFNPAVGDPQCFLLKGDEGCELLAKRLMEYHWKMDQAGTMTNIPDETDDDECDAFRYLIMNVYAPKGKVQAPADEAVVKPAQAQYFAPASQPQPWMQEIIQSHLGGPARDPGEVTTSVKGRKGSFKWDMT